MMKYGTAILIAGFALVILFGASTVAVNCGNMIFHRAGGMSSCPEAMAGLLHRAAAFLLLFSATLVILTVANIFVFLPRAFVKAPDISDELSLFRGYITTHFSDLAFSLPSILFSSGILHRKEAPAFIS